MPSEFSNTSPSRLNTATNSEWQTKLRVDAATANLTGLRCVIENLAEDEYTKPDYAHCLGRKYNWYENLMKHLEFVWNMQLMSLQIDSNQNIMRLSPKFHALFDEDMWLLLPEAGIVRDFHTAANKTTGNQVREAFDKANPKDCTSYFYTLIPNPGMQQVPIHRSRFGDQDVPEADSEEEFSFHSFPYDDFPTIELHVHPKFVICNAGQKLQDQPQLWYSGPGRTQSRNHKAVLDMIVSIWSVWNKKFVGSADFQSFGRSPPATKNPRVVDPPTKVE